MVPSPITHGSATEVGIASLTGASWSTTEP
jgi:hypothetical protein